MVALYSFRAVESGDLSLEKVSSYFCTFNKFPLVLLVFGFSTKEVEATSFMNHPAFCLIGKTQLINIIALVPELFLTLLEV